MSACDVYHLVGVTFGGRYLILPELVNGSGEPFKQGAHAAVYRAAVINAKAGEIPEVCVKVFSPDPAQPLSDAQKTYLESCFRREANFYASARHPGVVQLFDAGVETLRATGDAILFQVLECMAGGTVDAHCRQLKAAGLRLSVGEVLDYLGQIVPAVANFHRLGIIHRDLKPKNLLLSADRLLLKVADFGVAEFLTDGSDVARVGADIWAPPEHHPKLRSHGPSYLTPASDVYTLAKTTYFLLSCETPWEFTCAPVTRLPPSISGEAWARRVLNVLRKATSADPATRHQSATAFFEDLRVAFSSEQGENEMSTKDATVRDLKISRHRALTRRGKRFACIAVAVGIIAALISVGAHLDGRSSDSIADRGEKLTADALCRPSTGLVNLVAKTTTGVNLRVRPTKGSPSLCVIYSGTSVMLLGDSRRGWYQVRVIEANAEGADACEVGKEGWSYGEFYDIECPGSKR